jgi:hypothetical protein
MSRISVLGPQAGAGWFSVDKHGTLLVFEQVLALEDTNGYHTCSLEALVCVWPIAFLSGGVHYLLPFALSMTAHH